MKSELVKPTHLARRAVVYVRQSTPHQVVSNQESLRLQYALRQRARELGWRDPDIDVIDADLGLSAASAATRDGFKELVGRVGLSEVGLILSIDVTRLARNCSDWYPLLDICGLRGCLIADRDGVYDPGSANGRLLLGLKGTMSEYELSLMRQRGIAARDSKAKRGEFRFMLPPGFCWSEAGKIEIDPDEHVADTIRLIFAKFRELGSARQVFLWLRAADIKVPVVRRNVDICKLVWKAPAYHSVVQILHNPLYAGAYAFGRTAQRTRIVEGRARKSARGGRALLTGLMRCGRCGRMMRVFYGMAKGNAHRYQCRGDDAHVGAGLCIGIGGVRIDRAVAMQILEAVSDRAVEAAIFASDQAERSRTSLLPSSGNSKPPAMTHHWPDADMSWSIQPSVTSPANWKHAGTMRWSGWPPWNAETRRCPRCQRRARRSIVPACLGSITFRGAVMLRAGDCRARSDRLNNRLIFGRIVVSVVRRPLGVSALVEVSMDFSLSGEQRELKEMVRDFAEAEVAPAQDLMDRDHEFPYELWRKWSELGMAGAMIPEEFGGSGLDSVSYILAMEELGTVSQTFALIWQVHVLVSNMYTQLGTNEQKQKWLPPFARGEKLGAIGLTEPEAGSDAGGMRTRAVRESNEGWVVNGRKIFISNAGTKISDGLVVMAVTGNRPDGRSAISSFIMPAGTPGFELGQSFEKMAWHGMDNRELLFNDVKLGNEHLLGAEGAGLKQALGALNLGRIVFGTLGCALTRASLNEALRYSKERKQFGQPLSSFQLTQAKLADMAAHAEAIRRFAHYVAWMHSQGMECHTEAAMLKLVGTRLAVQAATDAYQIHGGYGFMSEFLVNRLYREAQILEIGEGTTEVQQLLIARALGC